MAIDETSTLLDQLTGLPGRALLIDRLTQALARSRRPRSPVAVLCLGIDGFREINDSLGHYAGDELLVAMVPRLLEGMRPSDTVARFGGDEFVLVCESLSSEAGAVKIAERIIRSLSEPVIAGGVEHYISVSIGIVVLEGGHAVATDVLRDASAAMNRAKAQGGKRYEVFDEATRERLLARLSAERELREAIDRGELRLFYQPVVSLAERRVIGAEALVRWQHPTRGLLLPADFIAFAEESGAILSLGKWVIEGALHDSAGWKQAFPDLLLSVSLNLSVRQVGQVGIPVIVRELLRSTGADPSRIELEFTESALLDPNDTPAHTLAALKELGVGLVLDDFGAGSSSLSALKSFPIDAIKIDRSFVAGVGQDLEDTAIVAAIIGIAGALGIRVIAEGVETEAQAASLRTLGCDYAQGFLYSPPVPADVFSGLLSYAAAELVVAGD